MYHNQHQHLNANLSQPKYHCVRLNVEMAPRQPCMLESMLAQEDDINLYDLDQRLTMRHDVWACDKSS
ncbi:hypothetical protein BPAE_0056g00450 [Botrytis paeoniae]|uniref:Uncharacterized protein n=1 Tax=Botrytis paeoniae TaxID=278948 RepID=A0A4Z1FWT9_9HELO|nr:hypothetical protein BPAE_0056g00450 [Botrytis paeoniae]